MLIKVYDENDKLIYQSDKQINAIKFLGISQNHFWKLRNGYATHLSKNANGNYITVGSERYEKNNKPTGFHLEIGKKSRVNGMNLTLTNYEKHKTGYYYYFSDDFGNEYVTNSLELHTLRNSFYAMQRRLVDKIIKESRQ